MKRLQTFVMIVPPSLSHVARLSPEARISSHHFVCCTTDPVTRGPVLSSEAKQSSHDVRMENVKTGSRLVLCRDSKNVKTIVPGTKGFTIDETSVKKPAGEQCMSPVAGAYVLVRSRRRSIGPEVQPDADGLAVSQERLLRA
jgi:hypothetical protein